MRHPKTFRAGVYFFIAATISVLAIAESGMFWGIGDWLRPHGPRTGPIFEDLTRSQRAPFFWLGLISGAVAYLLYLNWQEHRELGD